MYLFLPLNQASGTVWFIIQHLFAMFGADSASADFGWNWSAIALFSWFLGTLAHLTAGQV